MNIEDYKQFIGKGVDVCVAEGRDAGWCTGEFAGIFPLVPGTRLFEAHIIVNDEIRTFPINQHTLGNFVFQ